MRFFSVFCLFFASSIAFAQETANFTQFFVNPYVINPSFAGIEGKSGLFLTYRMQWIDFDGGPRVGNASFHTGLGRNVGFGISATNDRRGALNTSSGLVTFSYAARLGDEVYLRFGASGGIASNGLNLVWDPTDPGYNLTDQDDPALISALENNMFLLGNAGLSLHVKSFHLGASMPDLFEPRLVSDENFSLGDLRPTERFIFTASNRFYFGNDKHVFEPYVLYRLHKTLPSQLEAAAIMHLNHTVWLGGTYKQDFGISATAGFKVPQSFGVGYSFTFKNLGVNQIQSPTHEFTLSLLFGEKKPRRQKYSFVNTIYEKEQPVRVTAAPTGEAEQTFCEIDNPTVAELRATGNTIQWYGTATGGSPMPRTMNLLDGKVYYATQTQNKVESEERFAVTVNIVDTQAPRADQLQEFKNTDNPIVSDLTSESDKTIWYDMEAGGSALPVNQILREGSYYASQVIDGCESSERLPVNVTIEQVQVEPDTVVTIPVEIDSNLNQQQTTDETVVVKRGGHLLELPAGVYVVVGVFSNYENAEKFSDSVFIRGYHDTQFGYISEKGYFYVFVRRFQDGGEARTYRDDLRRRAFRDAWVLEVQN